MAGTAYGIMRGDEATPSRHFPTSKRRLLFNSYSDLRDVDDDVCINATKRRRLQYGSSYGGVDYRRTSPTRRQGLAPGSVQTSIWRLSCAPAEHGADHGAQHHAGPGPETFEWHREKPSQAQYVEFSSVHPFPVSGPSNFSLGPFTTSESISTFPPAALQPHDTSPSGHWHTDAAGFHYFHNGPEQVGGGLTYPMPRESLPVDGASSFDVSWPSHGLPSPASMDERLHRTSVGASYPSSGCSQSPFSPSPLEPSSMSLESSPFPKAPSDAVVSYFGDDHFPRRTQGTDIPAIASLHMNVYLSPVDPVTPNIATAPSRELPSPPSDGTEIAFRSPSPPDLEDSWNTERHFHKLETKNSEIRNDAVSTSAALNSQQNTFQDGHPHRHLQLLGGDYVDLGEELAHNGTVAILANGPPEQQPRKRVKGKLEASVKAQICETRKMGACLRCHNQRAKCEPNELDPKNLPCKTCEAVNKSSRKTIHNLPCIRFKITAISLFRRGGLGYTTRFTHESLEDVPGHGDIYTISMASGLAKAPVKLKVWLFRPNSGDVLDRKYVHKGVVKVVRIPPYCLVDVQTTSKEFVSYVNEHAFGGLEKAVEDENIIIRKTFKLIAKHCEALPEYVIERKSGQEVEKPNEEKELLRDAVRLWFAIRHGIGTSTLEGERPPGLEPIHDPDNPFHNDEVPAMPRMIVAQFDSIRHEKIYKNNFPRIMKLLEAIFASKNMNAWFTGYLVTFLFLDLVSSASSDRLRWAVHNSEGKPMESRYGPTSEKLASFVEELHHAAKVMLLWWHYYKRIDLMETKWDNLADQPLKSLKPEEIEHLKWTVEELNLQIKLPVKEGGIPKTPSEGSWENSMFWISQMFTSFSKGPYNWAPPDGFLREKPSVGRDVYLTV